MTEKVRGQTTKDRIIALLKKGYTRSQLINDFNFAERTVDAAIKEYKELYGDARDVKRTKGNGETKTDMLPAKAKPGEIVIPEWIATEMVNIFDGNERDWRIYLAGLATPILGVRLIQEMVKPLTDMMLAMRKEEVQAMLEAQGMGREIAETAAQQVASKVIQNLKHEGGPSPIEQLMADLLRQPLTQLVTKMMTTVSQQQQPGASFPPGQSGSQIQPTVQTLKGPQVSGRSQVSKEEIQEVFDA